MRKKRTGEISIVFIARQVQLYNVLSAVYALTIVSPKRVECFFSDTQNGTCDGCCWLRTLQGPNFLQKSQLRMSTISVTFT